VWFIVFSSGSFELLSGVGLPPNPKLIALREIELREIDAIVGPMSANPPPPRRFLHSDPSRRRKVNIETVQRWVFAVILIHIGGSPTLALAAYSPHAEETKHSAGVGLWIMSGVVGLVTTTGVLVITQHSLISPWLILGVLPMAVAAFYVF
jgi:hypothetical protein